MKWLWIIFLITAIAVGTALYLEPGSSGETPEYRTGKVDRHPLLVHVTCTGTLQAVTTVQVGTQISGVVEKLFVDFNDRVTEGQVVAQLDTALLRVRLDQDKAALARSESNLKRLDVVLAESERNLSRQKELFAQKIASQNDLDAAQFAWESAKAQVLVARSEVEQSRAAVSLSEINLRYATITSPISGVVISRSVDVGQTVAASLSAPTLFTIANDLSKMWVLANVDEADIGKVAPGQKATFSVDSFPEREFEGRLRQIRLQPTVIQNVVMYTVVIDVDNPERILLPGLTANLSILVDQAENSLRVPNAALRFQPVGDWGEPPSDAERTLASSKSFSSGTRREKPANGAASEAKSGKPGRVYRVVGGDLEPVEVRTGRTDGAFTEIVSGKLNEGDEVALGLQQPSAASAGPQGRSPWSRRR